MKKKWSKLICLLVALTLIICLAGCGSDAGNNTPDKDSASDQQTWELSASIHISDASVKTQFINTWAERVYEATDGRVKITVFPGGTLVGGPGALDAIKTQTVDIAWVYTPFTPGQFPLLEVVCQPMIGLNTSPQGTNVLWDLWESTPELQAELDPYKVLMLYTNPANGMSFADAEVKDLDSLKGMRLRAAAGSITDILTLWGAEPMLMGPGDIYSSLEKGVIDGYVFDFSGILDMGLDEVTHNYVEMNVISGPVMLLMNKELWDSFPADIQEAINSVSDRACSYEMAQIFQNDEDAVKAQIYASENANVITVSDEAYEEFKAIADDYNAQWAAKISENGFDGETYLSRTLELIEQYKDSK